MLFIFGNNRKSEDLSLVLLKQKDNSYLDVLYLENTSTTQIGIKMRKIISLLLLLTALQSALANQTMPTDP